METGSTNETFKPWIVPIIVLASLFSAIPPAFYFALYRNLSPIQVSKNLRALSLIAAIGLGLLSAVGLWNWAGSLVDYWTAARDLQIFNRGRDAGSILFNASTGRLALDLLTQLLGLSYLIPLTALSRRENEELEASLPASDQLKIITKIAVIAQGLSVLLFFVQFIGAPYGHTQTRNYALQMGRTPPPFWPLMLKATRNLLGQACLLAAPLVVYWSQSRAKGASVQEQP